MKSINKLKKIIKIKNKKVQKKKKKKKKKQEKSEERKKEKEQNRDERDKSEEIQENTNKEEIKENINEAEIKAIEETLENLDQIKAVLVESKENAEEIDQFIDDKNSEVDKIFNNIKDLSINVSSRLDEFMTEYTESIEPTVLNEVNNDKNTLANGRELLSDIDKTIPEVERLLNRTSKDIDEGEESLETVLNEYPYVNDKVGELADKLRDIKEEADINEIIELLQNDPEAGKVFFSEPVLLDEHSVFPIENYGSGMTPFYTILSLWVGGLLLISLLSTN